MNDHQRGLFGRGLENWEESCGSGEADIAMSVSNAFSSSVGMALFENDVVMEDRVSVSIVLDQCFIDYSFRYCCWRVG